MVEKCQKGRDIKRPVIIARADEKEKEQSKVHLTFYGLSGIGHTRHGYGVRRLGSEKRVIGPRLAVCRNGLIRPTSRPFSRRTALLGRHRRFA